MSTSQLDDTSSLLLTWTLFQMAPVWPMINEMHPEWASSRLDPKFSLKLFWTELGIPQKPTWPWSWNRVPPIVYNCERARDKPNGVWVFTTSAGSLSATSPVRQNSSSEHKMAEGNRRKRCHKHDKIHKISSHWTMFFEPWCGLLDILGQAW